MMRKRLRVSRSGREKSEKQSAVIRPEVLRLETVDDPVPGPSDAVVELRAAGVNPADTYMRSGTYIISPKLRYIPAEMAVV